MRENGGQIDIQRRKVTELQRISEEELRAAIKNMGLSESKGDWSR